jgi:hypothetical protein
MNRWPDPGTTLPVAVVALTVTMALSGAVRPDTRFTVTTVAGVPSAPV